MAPPGNQAANREHKHRPTARGVSGLLETAKPARHAPRGAAKPAPSLRAAQSAPAWPRNPLLVCPERSAVKLLLNNARFKRLAKEGTWIVAGKIAVVLGSLALVRVLTEFLTPAEYGQLALGLTLVALYGKVVFGGISAGIGRHYAIAAERNDLHGYLVASRRLLIYATIVSSALGFFITTGLRQTGYSDSISIALAAMLFAVLSGYNTTLNGIQNAARQRAIVALHSGLDAWLKIGLAVLLFVWLGSSSAAVILGFAASALLVSLSQLIFLRRTIKPLPNGSPNPKVGDWPTKIWRYSWPFSTWGVFTWMQQASDRWALGLFESTEGVGLYAVVFQLGYTPIAIVLGLSMTLLAPILYQRAGDASSAARNRNVSQIVWRITTSAVLLTMIAVLATSILHREIFYWLVALDYRQVSYLLPWMILAGGLFAAGQLLSIKILSEMASRRLLLPKIISALCGVSVNLAGAFFFGVYGVVAGVILFSALHLIWIIFLAIRSDRERNAEACLLGVFRAEL